jgi:hypothetical protein
MLFRGFAWASALGLLSGCGEQHRAGEPADAGTAPAEADGGDPNGTMDRAAKLRVGDFPGLFDSFDGKEDLDFFSFEGAAGEWVSIRTTDKSGLSLADTPITLYGPDRNKLASNRFAPSLKGENLLARIITRLPVSGRYYVGVSDAGAPSTSWGLSQPYRISVVDADGIDGYTVNIEGTSPTEARVATYDTPSGALEDVFLAGDFGTDDDEDAFSIDIAEGGARLIDAKIDTSGVSGNGSTSTPGTVWITDSAGSVVIGKIDGARGQASLTPPLAAGKYLLWAAHPKTNLGQNDFFVVRALIAPDNPMEAEDSSNGVITHAEPLAVEALDAAGTRLEAFILLHLGPDDVDYFRFDGKPDQIATVNCISRGDGSGVVGMHVSARDEDDEAIADAIEQGNKEVTLDPVPVPAKGALYLRLSKDAQLEDVVGDWVRCVVSAG